MENLVYKHQKSSDKIWIDEAGSQVQYSRLLKHERLMEKSAHRIAVESLKINAHLKSFKEEVINMCEEVYEQYLEDKQLDKIGKGKGNFTWFNFDRSIKIEMSIKERITFDEMKIQTCKDLLNQFLDENIKSKNQFIKEMVNEAFSTSRGKLDSKKVMNLLRYESKINAPLFQLAMKELKDSIRRPSSKMYFRVWIRDNEGEYQNIDLNFSSI